MLELTRQEKLIIIFLASTAILGAGILCCKKLIKQPKITVISGPITEKEVHEAKVININTASKEELVGLKGIGESMASEIVGYREVNGPFRDKEELKKVKGIGPAKYEAVKDYIKTE